MRLRRRPILLTLLLTQPFACGPRADVPMPPIRPIGLIELPRACKHMPSIPFQEPLSMGSDPRTCLRGEWRKQTFTAHLSIVDGRIRDVSYADDCAGAEIVFDRAVDASIRSSLETWRYPVEKGCVGQDAGWLDTLLLEPLPKPLRFEFLR